MVSGRSDVPADRDERSGRKIRRDIARPGLESLVDEVICGTTKKSL